MGALVGGMSAGVAEGVGIVASPYIELIGNKALIAATELSMRSGVGAVTGGVSSTITGGSFAEGASTGAWTAAYGLMFNKWAHWWIEGKANYKVTNPKISAV